MLENQGQEYITSKPYKVSALHFKNKLCTFALKVNVLHVINILKMIGLCSFQNAFNGIFNVSTNQKKESYIFTI